MKMKLFNSLICASILALAVSCGKSGGGGGGSNVAFTNPYVDQSSQSSLAALSNWYNSSTEGGAVQASSLRISRRQFQSSSSNSNCSNSTIAGGTIGDILGFLGLNNVQVCSGSSSSNQNQGTEVFSQVVNLNAATGTLISSKQNIELSALISKVSGSSLVKAAASGNKVQLVFLESNKLVTYIVDMNYHSQLNPVVKVESGQSSTLETRVFWQILSY